MLKEKHPEPNDVAEKAILHCNELQHIDVTAAHVEKVAQQIKGEPVPGGTLAMHWQDFLLP